MGHSEIETISSQEIHQYFANGISYNQYKLNMAQDLASNTDSEYYEYIKINTQRMNRVEKTYRVSQEISDTIIRKPNIKWLVIAEHWCGDAAQILPVLNTLVEKSGHKIDFKIVYRDQNLALMDAFLTNGSRSIPKLIQLNNDFEITAVWGPRPVAAQQLVLEMKADPATAPRYAEELHLWYAKDKQQAIEFELNAFLMQSL